ncbi:MAG: hypothetical protein ACRDJU_00145 [Actinomycetota bacterium]
MLKADAQRSWNPCSVIGAALFIAFGALVVLLRLRGDPTEPLMAGRVVAAIAFGCLYAAPGALALASGGRRPILVAAASLGFGLIPTSFSITPLLLFPSVLVLIGWAFTASPGPEPIRTLIVSALVVAAGAGAIGLLLTSNRTICWETSPTGRTTIGVGPVPFTSPPGFTPPGGFTPPPEVGLPVNEGYAAATPAGGGGGCDGGDVPAAHSAGALAMVAAGVGGALAIGRRRPRRNRRRRPAGGAGASPWTPRAGA